MTSLCEFRDGQKRVWACAYCGHLRGDNLPDSASYYDVEYRISLNHDNEDQIYEVRRDKNIVYRTEHQVHTLLDKFNLSFGSSVLDYGCAKASTPRLLLATRGDLDVHLFDVSQMYTAHWQRFIGPEQWAIHQTPPTWQKRFDLVTSFFALEHMPAPKDCVKHIVSLLKDSGTFYGIVPNAFGNVADFVVIDHVNHFTNSSLYTLLASEGFTEIEIDDVVHRGALVFSARKGIGATKVFDVQTTVVRANNLARYWSQLDSHLLNIESELGQSSTAIYGSGFYGAYIASILRFPERLRCFIDRSPFQQGKTLMGKPIIAPESLTSNIDNLYIGLNPEIARIAVADMEWLGGRDLKLVFLDGDQR